MNESVLYRHTLETMTRPQIMALVNLQEGDIHAPYGDMHIQYALVNRGLVYSLSELWQQERETHIHYSELDHITPYGHGFLAWYRQPHNIPQQMDMFEDQS